MEIRLNNREGVPVPLLLGTGLVSVFLFGASPVWATDLQIRKTADKSSYRVGEPITFTLTVDNTSTAGGGPLHSIDTTVVDHLASGVEFASDDPRVTYDPSKRRVEIDLEVVEAHSIVTVTLVAKAAQAGGYTNRATVEGGQSDSNPSGNEDD